MQEHLQLQVLLEEGIQVLELLAKDFLNKKRTIRVYYKWTKKKRRKHGLQTAPQEEI